MSFFIAMKPEILFTSQRNSFAVVRCDSLTLTMFFMLPVLNFNCLPNPRVPRLDLTSTHVCPEFGNHLVYGFCFCFRTQLYKITNAITNYCFFLFCKFYYENSFYLLMKSLGLILYYGLFIVNYSQVTVLTVKNIYIFTLNLFLYNFSDRGGIQF